MWWLLARIAGWNGIITETPKIEPEEGFDISIRYRSGEVIVSTVDFYLGGSLTLINLYGQAIDNKIIESGITVLNKPVGIPGIYFVKVTKMNLNEVKKILILK
jgi:hypothetical protein